MASHPIGRRRGAHGASGPDYIDAARRRYQGRIAALEVYVGDIQNAGSLVESADLLYAALVLEYVDGPRAMTFFSRHSQADGVLVVVTQRPHATLTEITPSPYRSLEQLAPGMKLVRPDTVVSDGGKSFAVDTFRRSA